MECTHSSRSTAPCPLRRVIIKIHEGAKVGMVQFRQGLCRISCRTRRTRFILLSVHRGRRHHREIFQPFVGYANKTPLWCFVLVEVKQVLANATPAASWERHDREGS